jgi:ADP-ribosyl-[dinitrogen reductase] hydrolase
MSSEPLSFEHAITGCLLGGAVGDALGLPWEGLSRLTIAARLGPAPLTHALIGRRGMLSDDTEHACMTAQALLAAPTDPHEFARSLAWRLRLWLLGLPAAIGWGTLRALVRLWLGFNYDTSGVRSAGNGPAMRAAILGAALGRDDVRLKIFVARSTRLTHTDPRALAGALAIARAAAAIVHRRGADDPDAVLSRLIAGTDDRELASALELARDHLRRRDPPETFACSLGQESGVSGYIHHTVPVALYCWAFTPRDFTAAIDAAVRLGGDTDTVAAIVGGLAGAATGPAAIPPAWLAGVRDFPRSPTWIARLARRLADSHATSPPRPLRPLPLLWPLLPLRNFVFAMIVLAHGFRRLAR